MADTLIGESITNRIGHEPRTELQNSARGSLYKNSSHFIHPISNANMCLNILLFLRLLLKFFS